MPPHLVLHDFLAPDEADALLAYALDHEAQYAATGVGLAAGERRVDPAIRQSSSLRDLGPFRALLKERMRGIEPVLSARLGTPPLARPPVELELVAHNDGAFYKFHKDTETGGSFQSIRVLSAVYYFHRRPQAFSGGALRLYAIGDLKFQEFIDIPPTHNSLLVFPSWAPHEVTRVSCPSQAFADSRFAINCWLRRLRPEGGGEAGARPA